MIVPTYRHDDELRSTLATLGDQQDTAREIIVVDNNRDLEWRERVSQVARDSGCVLVREDEPGPAAARNAGVAVATGDVVLFVDDDIKVPPSFVRSHALFHARHEATVGVGRIVEQNQTNKWFRAYLDRYQVVNKPLEQGHLDCRHFYTANASMRRDHFLAAGGFDTRFLRREDAELGVRLSKLGLSFDVVDGADVQHESTVTPRQYLRRVRDDGRYLAQMCHEHPELTAVSNTHIYRGPRPRAAHLVGPPLTVAGLALLPLTERVVQVGFRAWTYGVASQGFRSFDAAT